MPKLKLGPENSAWGPRFYGMNIRAVHRTHNPDPERHMCTGDKHEVRKMRYTFDFLFRHCKQTSFPFCPVELLALTGRNTRRVLPVS